MKRYLRAATKEDKKYVPPQDSFLKPFPNLSQLCTDLWWDDGAPREPVSIKVAWTSQNVSVILTDQENESSSFTTAPTFLEALELIEEALSEGRNLFKKWRNSGKKK